MKRNVERSMRVGGELIQKEGRRLVIDGVMRFGARLGSRRRW